MKKRSTTRQLLAPVAASHAPADAPRAPSIIIGIDDEQNGFDGPVYMLRLRDLDGLQLTAWLSARQLHYLGHVLAAAVEGDINASIDGLERVA